MSKLFYVIGALLGFGLCSCNNEAMLGKEIAGEWSAGSNVLPGIAAANAVTTDVYEFIPDSTYRGGEVKIVGMFNITLADDSTSGINEAVSTSVSGKSYVSGNYRITSHDEMIMDLAFDKVSVEFDPSTVVLENNTLTSVDSVTTGVLNDVQLQVLKSQITCTLQARYAGMRAVDDIKVNGDYMKFEILDTDYHLTR